MCNDYIDHRALNSLPIEIQWRFDCFLIVSNWFGLLYRAAVAHGVVPVEVLQTNHEGKEDQHEQHNESQNVLKRRNKSVVIGFAIANNHKSQWRQFWASRDEHVINTRTKTLRAESLSHPPSLLNYTIALLMPCERWCENLNMIFHCMKTISPRTLIYLYRVVQKNGTAYFRYLPTYTPHMDRWGILLEEKLAKDRIRFGWVVLIRCLFSSNKVVGQFWSALILAASYPMINSFQSHAI